MSRAMVFVERLRVFGVRLVRGRVLRLGGLSRAGVMASAERLRLRPLPSGWRQLLWVVPSSLCIGVGVSWLVAGDVGLSPLDVWMSAIEGRTPLSFGQVGWVTSAVGYLVALVLGVRPTLRGALFVVLNGFTIDACLGVFSAPDGIVERVVMAVGGFGIIVVGVSIIITKVGAGGWIEAWMEAAERRGLDPMRVRTFIEIGLLTAGIVLGGGFGPMTVVIALSVGPAIMVGIQVFVDHQAGRAMRLAEQAADPVLTN